MPTTIPTSADALDPDIPTVTATVTHDGAGHRTVVVACPSCGRVHVHGWPPGDADVGYRTAHCRHGGDYRVTATTRGGGSR